MWRGGERGGGKWAGRCNRARCTPHLPPAASRVRGTLSPDSAPSPRLPLLPYTPPPLYTHTDDVRKRVQPVNARLGTKLAIGDGEVCVGGDLQ